MSPAWWKTQPISSFGPAMNPSSDIIVWTKTLPILTSAIVLDNKTTARGQTSSVQQMPVGQAFCRSTRTLTHASSGHTSANLKAGPLPALNVRSGFAARELTTAGRDAHSGRFPAVGANQDPEASSPMLLVERKQGPRVMTSRVCRCRIPQAGEA
jgi:hypothetical protein